MEYRICDVREVRQKTMMGRGMGHELAGFGKRFLQRFDAMMQDTMRNKTVIGADCHIRGDLWIDNDLVMMGQLDGTLQVMGHLEVGANAVVIGRLICGTLRLAGQVEGDVVAEESAELLSGASVRGKLYTPKLTMGENVTLDVTACVGPHALEKAAQLGEAAADTDFQQAIEDVEKQDSQESSEPAEHELMQEPTTVMNQAVEQDGVHASMEAAAQALAAVKAANAAMMDGNQKQEAGMREVGVVPTGTHLMDLMGHPVRSGVFTEWVLPGNQTQTPTQTMEITTGHGHGGWESNMGTVGSVMAFATGAADEKKPATNKPAETFTKVMKEEATTDTGADTSTTVKGTTESALVPVNTLPTSLEQALNHPRKARIIKASR